jgi:hypothetical protein
VDFSNNRPTVGASIAQNAWAIVMTALEHVLTPGTEHHADVVRLAGSIMQGFQHGRDLDRVSPYDDKGILDAVEMAKRHLDGIDKLTRSDGAVFVSKLVGLFRAIQKRDLGREHLTPDQELVSAVV